jgi:hypothetical protein
MLFDSRSGGKLARIVIVKRFGLSAKNGMKLNAMMAES